MCSISREVVRQPRNVAGVAPCLVHGEHMGGVGIGSDLAAIHIDERLAVGVLHFVATLVFARLTRVVESDGCFARA